MGFGAITGIENNPFMKKINGINAIHKGQPAEGVKKTGAGAAGASNPFAQFGDDGQVGLGIKDGAIQTSNGQMGKKIGVMRQLGIA